MSKGKRRKFSAEYKFETVVEALRGEKSAAQICRERDINENLLSRWKQEFVERGAKVFESRHEQKRDGAEQRIGELERLAGRQALEIEILKKAGSLLGSDWKRKDR
jgi:transposase-like protein